MTHNDQDEKIHDVQALQDVARITRCVLDAYRFAEYAGKGLIEELCDRDADFADQFGVNFGESIPRQLVDLLAAIKKRLKNATQANSD